jgi:hypothetical protein
LSFHGNKSTRSLETLKSAQARGEAIQTSDAGAEGHCESACTPRRASLSEPRGQHAHGIESFEKKTAKKRPAKRTARPRTARKSAKKTPGKTARTSSARAREKDPKGGLTAAGRAAFARKDGSHLKPGVTVPLSEMTPQDMRRKGSWAVRFYGRKKLPPLVDDRGKPTRHALSAHAWGEPVPRTVAAARRIAAKGERLLQRYRRIQQKR